MGLRFIDSMKIEPRQDELGRTVYAKDYIATGLAFGGAGILGCFVSYGLLSMELEGGVDIDSLDLIVLFPLVFLIPGLAGVLLGAACLFGRQSLTFDAQARTVTYKKSRLFGGTFEEFGYDKVRAEIHAVVVREFPRGGAPGFGLCCFWTSGQMLLQFDPALRPIQDAATTFEQHTGLTCQELSEDVVLLPPFSDQLRFPEGA